MVEPPYPSRIVQARALQALRPFFLFVALPVAVVFLGLEARVRPTPYLILEMIGMLVMVGSLLVTRSKTWRGGWFCVGMIVFAAMSFLHFGWVLGVGLFFCAATLSWTFFLGGRGAIGSATILTLVVAVALVAHVEDWWTIVQGPTNPVAMLRMIASTGLALSVITYVFFRVQLALTSALEGELDARVEQHIAQRDRTRAIELAMQAQRLEAAGRLASGVAHDFNNALMVLQGTIELLGREVDSKLRGELVAEGVAAVEGASATARHLLDFARPGGETEGRSEPGPVLERLARSMRRVLPESLVLTTEIEPCPTVPLPRGVLEQVVLNLVLNARDAISGPGSVVLRCSSNASNDALIEVRDTGSGMTEETCLHLFEPFFTTKNTNQGTGLGLVMAHAFVTHSSGTIEVDSVLGRGSRFVLRWPTLTEASESELGDNVDAQSGVLASSAAESRTDPGKRVLLIEDNRQVARVMARALISGGYAVTMVHTVAAARAELQTHRFALVCSDGVLPDGTALDVLDAYHKAQPSGVLLLCTGYADRPELTMVIERGARVLHKPFASAQLLEQVAAILAESKPATG